VVISSSNPLSSRSQDRVASARTQAEAEYKKKEASANAWIHNLLDYYDSTGRERRLRLCVDQIKQAAREFLRAVLFATLKELMNTDWAIDRIREASDTVFAELRGEVFDTKWPEKGQGWDRASEMRPYE